MKLTKMKGFIIFLITISLLECRETVVRKNKVSQIEPFLKEKIKAFSERTVGKDGDGIEYNNVKELSYLQQFNNDILILYKTLFPENKNSANILAKETGPVKNNEIINSLKTILFTMAEMGLYYGNKENGILNEKNLKDEMLWPYPLASAICHGGRTIFLIEKQKINSETFAEKFFLKDKKLLTARSTASHKVSADASKVTEEKIIFEASLDWIKSKLPNSDPKHFYMNIPIGGIGNYWPGKVATIGSQGIAINSSNEKLQAGHLYVRFDELTKSIYNSILLGLEEEAPDYKGMFSNKAHNFLNALKKPDVAVCGGKRWNEFTESTLKDKVPNTTGGKVVFLNKDVDLSILQKINNFEEDLQKKIWWIILSSNVGQYREFRDKFLQLDKDALKKALEQIP